MAAMYAVMDGLVPAIHVFNLGGSKKRMPGKKPGMTGSEL
jgi:hypothetical protein